MRCCLPAADSPWPARADELAAKCRLLGLSVGPAPAAVALQPLPIRRAAFASLRGRQRLWNAAVDAAARDFSFVRDALRETAASDAAFTGRLVRMLEDVYMSARPYQALMLGVLRADYMGGEQVEKVEEEREEGEEGEERKKEEREEEEEGEGEEKGAAVWKNVEVNTISCAFAGLAPRVTEFHRCLSAYRAALDGKSAALPLQENISDVEVPAALAAAVHAWRARVDFSALSRAHTKEALRPVVVFVVQANERNTADQHALRFALLESHGILSLRLTLQELRSSMRLVPAENRAEPPHAIIDDKYLMVVAYFRSTYAPADFPDESAWEVRGDVERSSAVKCPSIPYHLLTFKKLQQLFCDVEQVLAPIAFGGDKRKAQQLQEHFVPQYSLNPSEIGETRAARLMEEAARNPDAFVLKPQLEGGGNLIAGEAMRSQLTSTDPATRNKVQREYILMSRIAFPLRSGSMLVNGEVLHLKNNLCSEIGVFGTVLSDGVILRNEYAGYVVRTKPADMEDGGVMTGVAALDSLALY